MPTNDDSLSHPFAQQRSDAVYADLETKLLEAVSDFGVDELSQMLDVAKALRRARRL